MEWKDAYESSKVMEVQEENNLNDPDLRVDLSSRGKNAKRSLFKRAEMPYILLGAALFVSIVGLALFFSGSGETDSAKQFEMLESKLVALEKRLASIEDLNGRVDRISKRNQAFGLSLDKFDQLETSVTRRMDFFARELDKFQKSLTALEKKSSAPQKASTRKQSPSQARATTKASQASKKQTLPSHHQVRPGETLYSIGRRYGVPINELLRLNELSPSSAIYPGQRIKLK